MSGDLSFSQLYLLKYPSDFLENWLVRRGLRRAFDLNQVDLQQTNIDGDMSVLSEVAAVGH